MGELPWSSCSCCCRTGEPVTAEPTIWLRLTRTDVAESVERYALALGQLRALAAAAIDVLRLIQDPEG